MREMYYELVSRQACLTNPMNAALYPLMLLAGLGFVLSLAAHLAALAGIQIPGGELVWGLHIGIFVVWFPTVLVANRMTRDTRNKDFWKNALAGCPRWMQGAAF